MLSGRCDILFDGIEVRMRGGFICPWTHF
jgi:hypothetical protein